jgi:hypothetical protein
MLTNYSGNLVMPGIEPLTSGTVTRNHIGGKLDHPLLIFIILCLDDEVFLFKVSFTQSGCLKSNPGMK